MRSRSQTSILLSSMLLAACSGMNGKSKRQDCGLVERRTQTQTTVISGLGGTSSRSNMARRLVQSACCVVLHVTNASFLGTTRWCPKAMRHSRTSPWRILAYDCQGYEECRQDNSRDTRTCSWSDQIGLYWAESRMLGYT